MTQPLLTSAPNSLDAALEQFWGSQQAAAIAEDKGTATWGQPWLTRYLRWKFRARRRSSRITAFCGSR